MFARSFGFPQSASLPLCRGGDARPISAESPGVKSIEGSVGKTTSPQSQSNRGRTVSIPAKGIKFGYVIWDSKDFV
jgi:hypothetical protein